MPKTKEQKKKIIEGLTEKIKEAKSIIFTAFSNLAVKDNELLRQELRKESGEYLVAKKTLLNLALQNLNLPTVKECQKNLSIIFGYGDEVTAARVAEKFRKDHPGTIEFAGGILEGAYLQPENISELAALPTKPQLYGRLAGSLNSPISGLANVMAGNIRGLLNIFTAISKK